MTLIFNYTHLFNALCDDLDVLPSDKRYLFSRIEHEGLPFVTKELPKISKAMVDGLEQGSFDRSSLTSFRFSGALLCLFKGWLSKVFDVSSGKVLDTACPLIIQRIRQICEYFYKLCLPYSNEVIDEATERFVDNENDLEALSKNGEVIKFAEQLRKDFETHWSEISDLAIHEILTYNRPRLTPGTFVGCSSLFYAEKRSTKAAIVPLHYRGHMGYFKQYPGQRHGFVNDTFITEGDFSELLLVPKDSRGPRTICREFPKRLESQMAFFDMMCNKLHYISRGAINFTDQEVNRNLSKSSSIDRRYATIDLKDASDRVSYSIIKRIFRNSPGCSFFLSPGNRASKVKLPNGRFLELQKLAGMGSGLTFPTMSLLISLAIVREIVSTSQHSYEYVRSNIFIYGDDIVIPREWVTRSHRALNRVGLKVNALKSFRLGFFRESCGADFYHGSDVSIVKCKLTNADFNINKGGILSVGNQDSFILQLYKHSKELYERGYHKASEAALQILRPLGILTPGVYSGECDLFIDFFKGYTHLSLNGTSTVWKATTKNHSRVDERKLISKDGQVFQINKYNLLRDSLNRWRDPEIIRVLPATGELAIPRCIVIKKTKRPNWTFVNLIKEQIPRSETEANALFHSVNPLLYYIALSQYTLSYLQSYK